MNNYVTYQFSYDSDDLGTIQFETFYAPTSDELASSSMDEIAIAHQPSNATGYQLTEAPFRFLHDNFFVKKQLEQIGQLRNEAISCSILHSDNSKLEALETIATQLRALL
jgi:hypothetical protein